MRNSFQRTVSDRVLDIPVTEDEPFPVKSGSGIAISSVEGEGNLVDLSGSTVAAGSLSFTANSQFAIIDTQGFESAAFTISGFGTATLAVQWSNLPTSGFVAGLVGTVGTTTTATSITANGQYTASSGGRYMKIIVTAFTTGPIVVTPVLQAGASVGASGAGGGDATAANQVTANAALAAIQAAAEDTTTPVPVKIDQTTPGTTNGVQVNAALPAGTNNIGDVDVLTLPALATGTNTIGAAVNVPRATANGFTSSRVNAAATTNATSLKGSAGNVGSIDVFNVAAYDVFLKLYNKASAPTVGTDTPVWTIPVKAGTGYSREFVQGKSFATGIAYAITKLQADSDTTVVVAGDLTGSIDWI